MERYAYTWMSLLAFCSALFPLIIYAKRPDAVTLIPATAGIIVILTFSSLAGYRATGKPIPVSALFWLDAIWSLSLILAFFTKPRILSIPTQAEIEHARKMEAELRVELIGVKARLKAMQEEKEAADGFVKDKLRLVEAQLRQQEADNQELRGICERH